MPGKGSIYERCERLTAVINNRVGLVVCLGQWANMLVEKKALKRSRGCFTDYCNARRKYKSWVLKKLFFFVTSIVMTQILIKTENKVCTLNMMAVTFNCGLVDEMFN